MKKIFILLATLSIALVSCKKSFDVKYTSQLTGSNAAAMVEADPTFLDSYVQGLYGTMCASGAGGSTSHDDYGVLSVLTNTEYMGGDIVLWGTQNWGLYDYIFDNREASNARPLQLWNTFYTLIDNSNEIPDFDFANNFVDGIKVLIIGLVYFIIPIIITLVLLFMFGAIGAGLDKMAGSLGIWAVFAVIIFIIFGITKYIKTFFAYNAFKGRWGL